jgi:predicted MPP superfamily phosphohydrolase
VTIIAQLSDPHIRVGPDDQNSARALANAVDTVLDLDPLPHAVLVTGDLADGGAAAEYDRFQELIAPLPMPVHVLPGNHDDLDWLAAEIATREPTIVAMRVVAGHVHRTTFAALGGRPVVTCASTNLQARLEIGSPGFTIADEPPAFLVHTLAIAHVQPVTAA